MAPDDHADDPGGHVTEQLESYLLGELAAAQEYEVEAHLLRCAWCRAEADSSSELAVALASLTAEDVGAMEPGEPPAGAARAEPDKAVRVPRQPATGSVAPIGPKPTPAAPTRAAPTRPPETRPGSQSGPRHRAQRQTVRRVAVYAAVLVLGLAVGAAGVLWISPGSFNGVPAGSESVEHSGQLSITLSDRGDGGTDVRAVVVGLKPGVAYELIAVGRDGRNHIIAQGVAAGGPQTLLGQLDGPAGDVLFYAVMQADADVLFVRPAP